VTWYPTEQPGWTNLGRWLGGQARAAIGLPVETPVVLDGLVSLWQVQ
jgi:protease-4